MMQFRKLIFIAFIFLLIGKTNAQPTVTLQEALEYALSNSEVIGMLLIAMATGAGAELKNGLAW